MKTAKHPKLKKKPAPAAAEGSPKIGDKRVWHIPQVPMQPFYVPVIGLEEAQLVINVLWKYDAFQFANNIKPDYSNASGFEVYVEDDGDGKPGWNEWENKEGETISDLMRHVQ